MLIQNVWAFFKSDADPHRRGPVSAVLEDQRDQVRETVFILRFLWGQGSPGIPQLEGAFEVVNYLI